MSGSNDLPGEMNTPTPDHDEYQPGTEPRLDSMFADLSRAAHAGQPVEPSDALQAFVSIGRVDVSDSATGDVVHDLGTVPVGAGSAPNTLRRKPLLSTFTALFASATSKLVLTGGLAAASVAGAHSTGVVDVPLLPDVNETAVVVVQDDESTGTDSDLVAQPDPSPSTSVPAAAATDDDTDEEQGSDADSGADASVTLTVNGEEIELTDDEIDTFLDDLEANIEGNTEAWEAAVATCEAAFDGLDIDADDAAAIDPAADLDAFMALVDVALQTCFDALDAAGFAGPFSGLDLDGIEDFDLNLDLDDLGEFDLDFDLDDLDGFPFGPEGFGDLDDFDFDDFDFDDFPFDDLEGFPFGPEGFGDFHDFDFDDLPFDPADPDALDQWLEDQGVDLDSLDDFDGLNGLDGFDGFDGFDFDAFDEDFEALLDQFIDEWGDFDEWDDFDYDDTDDHEDDFDDDAAFDTDENADQFDA